MNAFKMKIIYINYCGHCGHELDGTKHCKIEKSGYGPCVDCAVSQAIAETEARLRERLKGLTVVYDNGHDAPIGIGCMSDARAKHGTVDASKILPLIQELQPTTENDGRGS